MEQLVNGPKWTNGKFGQALSFDGVDDYVEVPHSSTLGFPAGTSFTLALWFKGTKVGGALLGKTYLSTQVLPWYLLWDDGFANKVAMYLRDDKYKVSSTKSAFTIGHCLKRKFDTSTIAALLSPTGNSTKEKETSPTIPQATATMAQFMAPNGSKANSAAL